MNEGLPWSNSCTNRISEKTAEVRLSPKRTALNAIFDLSHPFGLLHLIHMKCRAVSSYESVHAEIGFVSQLETQQFRL